MIEDVRQVVSEVTNPQRLELVTRQKKGTGRTKAPDGTCSGSTTASFLILPFSLLVPAPSSPLGPSFLLEERPERRGHASSFPASPGPPHLTLSGHGELRVGRAAVLPFCP